MLKSRHPSLKNIKYSTSIFTVYTKLETYPEINSNASFYVFITIYLSNSSIQSKK
jgi:hypothetical protein